MSSCFLTIHRSCFCLNLLTFLLLNDLKRTSQLFQVIQNIGKSHSVIEMVSERKREIRKWQASFFDFDSCHLELMPIGLIRLYIKISNSSFSEKHPNLKIEVKILLKRLPLATKLESSGIIFFNIQLLRHCEFAKGYAKFWFRPFKVWPRCFLGKITQIRYKVIIFFLEREEKIGSWLCHMSIFPWLKFFLMKILFFFSFGYLHGEPGNQSSTRSSNNGHVLGS